VSSTVAEVSTMDSFLIGAAIVVALYILVRLVLRYFFPPDS
jgi:hypothetical protein